MSLPAEWHGKRVRVDFTREGSSDAVVTLEDENEQGVFVRRDEEGHPAFIPWTSVMYIQLLEEPGEGEFFVGRAD
jgi:hypothetical protein